MVEVVGRVGGQLLHRVTLDDAVALSILWHLRLDDAAGPGADSAVVTESK